MKILYLLSILMMFCSCKEKKMSNNVKNKILKSEFIVSDFQSILDAANVTGAILVYDLNKEIYHSNDFTRTKKGQLPASTFKIPNSIIALETGVVDNDSTLFIWNGEKRRMKIWEQDLTFKQAFHFSCVPCYQEIARKVGVQRMNDYLEKLDYKTMNVNTTSIDMFWLQGDSKINQLQQIDFLKRFYKSELAISKATEEIMKRMMVIEETENYKVSGKTGWSINSGIDNGWFVGYVESTENTYFFATNVEPKEQFNMDKFPMIRKEVTYKALRKINIIN